MKNIQVSEFIGKEFCVASEDAQKLFEYLQNALNLEEEVILSFKGISVIVSVFLNVAIGQLYGCFCEDKIKTYIKIKDLEQDDDELLHRVIENAKKYYANSKDYDEAWRKEVYTSEEQGL